MQALILEEPGRLSLTNLGGPPRPAAGEALVRVHRVGVCGTDYHAFRGRQPFFTYPRILGHELGVEIVEINAPDSSLAPGDRCAVEPYLNCGSCIACRRDKPNCCAHLKVLGVHADGGLREYLTVPLNKLHRAENLDFEHLALVETLAIGAHAVGRAGIESGESVLVIGAGPIGLGAMLFSRLAGARVIALDVNEKRLEFCRDALHIEDTLVAGRETLGTLRELTDGDLPTAVFDATGHIPSMQDAFAFAAPGGRLTFVGLAQGDVAFADPEFHRREMTLLATRNATGTEFARIIDLMQSGAIDASPWFTHRAPLAQVPAQFSQWLDPEAGVVKAMIEI